MSSPLTREELLEGKLALIIIDIQYNLTAQGHGVFKYAVELGVREGYEYYYDRIQNSIIPNIQKLLKSFRESEKMIVFTKIRSGSYFKNRNKSDDEGVILNEVMPTNDDIIITKNDQDIFNGTGLDSLLKENGINTLIMAGVLTNECVQVSVLQAIENEYRVVLVEDSTAAFSEAIHQKAIDLIEDNSIIITSTEDILELL
ncbi:MAG: cysteine hydrolase family protein [Thermoplasmatota archaeon]